MGQGYARQPRPDPRDVPHASYTRIRTHVYVAHTTYPRYKLAAAAESGMNGRRAGGGLVGAPEGRRV